MNNNRKRAISRHGIKNMLESTKAFCFLIIMDKGVYL